MSLLSGAGRQPDASPTLAGAFQRFPLSLGAAPGAHLAPAPGAFGSPLPPSIRPSVHPSVRPSPRSPLRGRSPDDHRTALR